MRIWILKLSEPSPWDVAVHGGRPFRYSFLSRALVSKGHEVVWWTDDFQHFRKHDGHRFGRDHREEVLTGLTMRWIHTPGYARNVSLRRFRDHKLCARRFERQAGRCPPPDLILSSMPTDTMCIAATRLAHRWSIPVVLDVRDLWPDVFLTGHLPGLLRPLLWLLTRPTDRRVSKAFSKATAIVGNTPEFVQWGLQKAGREATALDSGEFPVGYQIPETCAEAEDAARKAWRARGVDTDRPALRAVFLGAFSSMYDIETILAVARQIRQIQFVLCGDGPDLDRIRREAAGLSNVVLPGRVSAPEVQVLLTCCSVGLLPYVDVPNFRMNLPNKPAEYSAHALALLSSIPGRMGQYIEQYGCGHVYSGRSSLAEILRAYVSDADLLERHGRQSHKLFQDVFDAANIYPRMVAHIELVKRKAEAQ